MNRTLHYSALPNIKPNKRRVKTDIAYFAKPFSDDVFSESIFLSSLLPAYQPHREQGEGYGGQCAGDEGRDAVELAGKAEEPSGEVEQ